MKALEQIAGLQTQYAPSAYIGLWTRLDGFKRERLTKALDQRRAVQATLMRVTIHIVSARDFHLLAAGVRQARRQWWLRVQRKALEGVDVDAVTTRVREFLADGPRRATDIQQMLKAEGYPPVPAASANMWVDLVRVPPSGTWERRKADMFGLADKWLGPSRANEEKGLRHLVRRYLGGFGPASISDIASWAGLPPATVKLVITRMRLRRFRDERGRDLLDLPEAVLPDPDTPAPVRFLPTWDANLLVHARRTQILPERYRPLIFTTKNPQSIGTFLVDGAVAGGWTYEKGRVRLWPFSRLSRGVRREVEDEAARLTAFHAD
ncbi:MAG TPA: winged helix DNA-binding domain-containing protein [bacterium]